LRRAEWHNSQDLRKPWETQVSPLPEIAQLEQTNGN
jgi:hypothetical protein